MTLNEYQQAAGRTSVAHRDAKRNSVTWVGRSNVKELTLPEPRDDDPQQGRGVIVWAFGAFLVALAIAVAVL